MPDPPRHTPDPGTLSLLGLASGGLALAVCCGGAFWLLFGWVAGLVFGTGSLLAGAAAALILAGPVVATRAEGGRR